MLVWRLLKTRYAAKAFDGEGARIYGGRWNSTGVAAAYASDSASLAVLEVLVHLRPASVLSSYSLVSASIPDELIESVDEKSLPKGWNAFPIPAEVQAFGDAWLEGRRAVALRLPNVLVPQGSNFLLNPAHPGFESVVVGPALPFSFDSRLTR